MSFGEDSRDSEDGFHSPKTVAGSRRADYSRRSLKLIGIFAQNMYSGVDVCSKLELTGVSAEAMEPKLKLPAGSKPYGWPDKIETDQIIKAEANCYICSARLQDKTAAVIKMYYRGGLFNFIRETILDFRAQREYRLLRHLANGGIPCSIPLFWTRGYCREYGFYEIIGTRQIPEAAPLDTVLSSEPRSDQPIDFGQLFQAVGAMHRCGVYHGALSTKNILIAATGRNRLQCYLIDLARGWSFPRSIFGQRIGSFDLSKLVRKIESHRGQGYCRPFLVQCGLANEALEQLYGDAYRYTSYSRKRKLIKNILRVKVFFLAVFTQLKQRLQ